MRASVLSRAAALAAGIGLAACAAPWAEREPPPGLGIVGTVTGATADGIEVNGLGVATTPATVLRGGFGPVGALERATIPPGHVVELVAEREAARLVAREIEPIFALAGPVTGVVPEQRRLVVMNTDVLVHPDAVLPAGGFAAFRPGQQVAVSGLWRGDDLVASRIDFQTPKASAREVVSGVVTPLPGARYRIGGVPLAAEWGTLLPGYFHVVSGEWLPDALLVDEVRVGRSVIGSSAVEALVVEGYGRARDFAGFHSGYPGPDREGYFDGYTFAGEEGKFGDEPAWRDSFVALGGLGWPVDERDREIAAIDGERALFIGDFEHGFDKFDVDYLVPLPEDLAERRAVLAGVDPLLPDRALYID